MFIGSFGPIVFSVSSLAVLTLNNIARTAGKRTTTHTVIEGKPITEYLGADLQSFKFDITLSAEHGVRPRAMLDALAEMAEGKMAYPLQIGGRPVGKHMWSLDQVSESWNHLYSLGELSEATVSLSLTEYIETM
jgi:hypothetical protein